MLNVSSAVKAKFQSDLCRKELKITIGSTVLTNAAIYKDGFKLTECVMDGTVEFVGCIASILEFKISTTALAKGNYKGQTVIAEVAVYLDENTLSSYIPLFHGYVDECTKSADGYYQQFVCYDRLAYLSDEPGYNMYKAAFNGSSIDLETFRDVIVLDCGMDAVNNQTLPNDDIIFKKRKRNKDVTAMALLRHIAQINGCFGILNRNNRFEFRQIDDAASPESIAYYRDMKYSDYVVRPVGDSTTNPPTGSITIRTNSQDAGVTVDWTNYSQYAGTDPGWSDESQDTYLVDDNDDDVVVDSYIIEGNLIAYKLKKSKKQVIGANILASLGHDAVFREHSVKCNGLPYVECCDKVLFTKGDNTQIEFVVTKRVLEGVQNMTDTYSCTITAQDANNKTFVSNVDNSTNSLGGNPDEALGLTEKTIAENGTYSALDDGAEGYSQVIVNVPSSGGGTSILVWGRSPQVAKYDSTQLKVYNHSYIDGYYIYNSTYLMMGFPGVYAAFDDKHNPKALAYDMEHDTDVKSTTGVKIAGRNHLVPGNRSTGMLVIGNANTWTGRDKNNNILFHAQNSVMELRDGYLLKAKTSGDHYVTLPCDFFYGCCLQVETEIYIMPYNTTNPNNYLYKSTDWGETWTVDATAPFSADIVIDNAIEYNGKILFFVSSLTIGGIYEYDMILKTFTKIDDHAFGGKSNARLYLFNGKIYMAGGDYTSGYNSTRANLVFSWDGNVLKTEESIPYEGMYYSGSYYAGRYLRNGQLLSNVTPEHKYLIYYGGGDSSYNSAEYWTAELTEINS